MAGRAEAAVGGRGLSSAANQLLLLSPIRDVRRCRTREAAVRVADEEDAPVPPHVPFHVAVRVPPPACATLGLPPRLTEGTKSAAGEPDENDATLAHCLTQSRRTPWCDLASD